MACGCAWGAGPSAVLVELFTSEGCSSCPPADALLRKLAGEGQVIAMSEHVDYWNRLGWKDPFSSSQMTERQEGYAARFRSRGPYTPQMVVDGVEEFVGSDSSRAQRAVRLAAERPKIELHAEMVDGGVRVMAPATGTRADVWVAVTHDPEPSQVAGGENSGRRLLHVSVVKWLKRVGEIRKGKAFEARVPVAVDAGLKNARVVVFAQEGNQGRVLGVARVVGVTAGF